MSHKPLCGGSVTPRKCGCVEVCQWKIDIRQQPSEETARNYQEPPHSPKLCTSSNENPNHDRQTVEQAGMVIGHSQAEDQGSQISNLSFAVLRVADRQIRHQSYDQIIQRTDLADNGIASNHGRQGK